MEENPISANAIVWCKTALQLAEDEQPAVTALRVEASHRSFYRVHAQAGTHVFMHSPPELENNVQFLQLAALFHHHHIPVPEVVAVDLAEGYFLLEDLGSTHLQELYDTPAQNQAVQAAILLLPSLGAIQDPAIPLYDVDRLHMELALFDTWFVQKFLQQQINTPTYQAACAQLVESAEEQPKCCVHRDYHCRNILYHENNLGIVDFQDALHGPILYDPASLLRDCYHTFSEQQISHWLDVFVSHTDALKNVPRTRIQQWFDFIAIQRQLKAIGIFARLHLRDNKSSHLKEIRPLLSRLINLLAAYPTLHPLQTQLQQCSGWASTHPALK